MLNLRWKVIQFNIGLKGLDQFEIEEINTALSEKPNSFYEKENCIPLFEKTGEVFTPNLIDAIPQAFFHFGNVNFKERKFLVDVSLPENELFVKHFPTNRLLQINGFYAKYEIVR